MPSRANSLLGSHFFGKPMDLENASLRRFLGQMTAKYSLGKWIHGPFDDLPNESLDPENKMNRALSLGEKVPGRFVNLSDDPEANNRVYTRWRVCELVWRGSNFHLRAYDLQLPSNKSLDDHWRWRRENRAWWKAISCE